MISKIPCHLPSPEDWSELNCLRPFVEAHQAFEKSVTTRKKTWTSREPQYALRYFRCYANECEFHVL